MTDEQIVSWLIYFLVFYGIFAWVALRFFAGCADDQ